MHEYHCVLVDLPCQVLRWALLPPWSEYFEYAVDSCLLAMSDVNRLTRFRIVIARLERAGGDILLIEKVNILKAFEHASEH